MPDMMGPAGMFLFALGMIVLALLVKVAMTFPMFFVGMIAMGLLLVLLFRWWVNSGGGLPDQRRVSYTIKPKPPGYEVHKEDLDDLFSHFEADGYTVTRLFVSVPLALRISQMVPDVDVSTTREFTTRNLVGHVRTADVFLDKTLEQFEVDVDVVKYNAPV
jgi:hypothetical protein